MILTENVYDNQGIKLKNYEVKNGLRPLVLLHAQGVDSLSFAGVIKTFSKKFHVYAVDCYGHGGSLHDPAQYHVKSIGEAINCFIRDVIGQKIWLLGHSCFTVESQGYRIVLDPYKGGSVPGLAPVWEEADQVLCSHGHGGHCGTECVSLRQSRPSPFTVETIEE